MKLCYIFDILLLNNNFYECILKLIRVSLIDKLPVSQFTMN